MCFSQITGDDQPQPGRSVFQTTFFGGAPRFRKRGALAQTIGLDPRNCGQFLVWAEAMGQIPTHIARRRQVASCSMSPGPWPSTSGGIGVRRCGNAAAVAAPVQRPTIAWAVTNLVSSGLIAPRAGARRAFGPIDRSLHQQSRSAERGGTPHRIRTESHRIAGKGWNSWTRRGAASCRTLLPLGSLGIFMRSVAKGKIVSWRSLRAPNCRSGIYLLMCKREQDRSSLFRTVFRTESNQFDRPLHAPCSRRLVGGPPWTRVASLGPARALRALGLAGAYWAADQWSPAVSGQRLRSSTFVRENRPYNTTLQPDGGRNFER